MFVDVVSVLIASQRSRPLTLAGAISALFLPGSLIIFLSRPILYATYGLSVVLFLSVAVSFPIVTLCFGICYAPLSAVLKVERLTKGTFVEEEDLDSLLQHEDPLEWPGLLAGGWLANLILYSLAAYSYAHPLRLGATFLLTASILGAIWLVVAVASSLFETWAEARLKRQSTPRAA